MPILEDTMNGGGVWSEKKIAPSPRPLSNITRIFQIWTKVRAFGGSCLIKYLQFFFRIWLLVLCVEIV